MLHTSHTAGGYPTPHHPIYDAHRPLRTRTMWAVGPCDGQDWIALSAPDYRGALIAYELEHGHALPEDLSDLRFLDARRVPLWDDLRHDIMPADWLSAGLPHPCARCGTIATLAADAATIGPDVFCKPCADEI